MDKGVTFYIIKEINFKQDMTNNKFKLIINGNK